MRDLAIDHRDGGRAEIAPLSRTIETIESAGCRCAMFLEGGARFSTISVTLISEFWPELRPARSPAAHGGARLRRSIASMTFSFAIPAIGLPAVHPE
jgi:hypothetical protein